MHLSILGLTKRGRRIGDMCVIDAHDLSSAISRLASSDQRGLRSRFARGAFSNIGFYERGDPDARCLSPRTQLGNSPESNGGLETQIGVSDLSALLKLGSRVVPLRADTWEILCILYIVYLYIGIARSSGAR